jgi:hypothetical protein
MPIQRCKLPGGGSGFRWGENGKCYPNRSGALKQMRAIKYSQEHASEKNILEKVGDVLKEQNKENK